MLSKTKQESSQYFQSKSMPQPDAKGLRKHY